MDSLFSGISSTISCRNCHYPAELEADSCANCGSSLEMSASKGSRFSTRGVVGLLVSWTESLVVASVGLIFLYLLFRVSPFAVMFPLLFVFGQSRHYGS